uniref:EF-hand domain-containing protein n=1 Tax=Chrysotila carterae TaxID=13221 RepID=A0A7S4C682_CHRCT
MDQIPQLKTAITALSSASAQAALSAEEPVAAFDSLSTLGGDFLAPSLLSSIDHGRGMVAVMNAVPIDVVCFGNHECDVPFDSMVQRVNEFKGVWLNSNMKSFTEETEELRPGACPPHHLLQLSSGRRVALIGLLCGGGKDEALYRPDAFGGHAARITPVIEAVEGAVKAARDAYPGLDCIVPLTHQDFADDIRLAEISRERGYNFPAILGGHDHAVFNDGKHGCPIVKAGMDVQNVAVVDLIWHADAPRNAPPSEVNVQMVPLMQPRRGPPLQVVYAPDAELSALCEKKQRPATDLQQATLAVLPPGSVSSVGVREGENTMASLLASAMRDAMFCDGALINAGSVRGNKVYESGEITLGDLSEECPFPSVNLIVPVEGAILSQAVQYSRLPWIGGASGGQSSGDALHTDDLMRVDPASCEVVEVDGKPIDPDKLYKILIDSYQLRCNPVFEAYCTEYPNRVPPQDTGQPALPILVKYFCDQVWCLLLTEGGKSHVSLSAGERLFADANQSGSGELTEEELLDVISRRLGGRQASKVLAKQCLSHVDADKNGTVSWKELCHFLKTELRARDSEICRYSEQGSEVGSAHGGSAFTRSEAGSAHGGNAWLGSAASIASSSCASLASLPKECARQNSGLRAWRAAF